MKKTIYIAQNVETYDAIVVGSGISGGWAAKELTEKGLKTLLLERGRDVVHGKDYIGEHKKDWELPNRGRVTQAEAETDYPIQSTNYAFGEATKHFFVKDSENPYVQVKPFRWLRGYHVGGRSLIWGRQTYRWSAMDFEANAIDGYGVDWPIRYDDLEPWYEYVERFAGISGEALGLPQLPDSIFLPPMELSVVEKAVRDAVKSTFPERNLTIGRCAILTENHNGRAACHYCGPCHRGCSTGSYFSSQSATLPAAIATSNLTLRPHSVVHSVIYNPETGKADGVRVIDTVTKEALEFKSKVVFLCASTLGSTQILMNSTSSQFPTGLGNASGALGHYLMDHHFQLGARGVMEGYEDRYYQGNRPNGIYVPRFRNISPETRHPDFVRGYGFQGGSQRPSWMRGVEDQGFGVDLKQTLRNPGPWEMGFGGYGECLPYYDNFVELDPEQTDQWGIPLLRISAGWKDNERAMRKDIQATAVEMLEAAGAIDIEGYDNYDDAPPGYGIHEMGTARMGRDPQTSVLNGNNQIHDVPNVFVTDGACMTSNSCVNPSLTYMALTARAASFAVEALKNGNI